VNRGDGGGTSASGFLSQNAEAEWCNSVVPMDWAQVDRRWRHLQAPWRTIFGPDRRLKHALAALNRASRSSFDPPQKRQTTYLVKRLFFCDTVV
jgi:hypothetical protein